MTRMISIIVPVYNEEKYLPQCLDSLVNQTYRGIEIICINDGSTDRSLEILKRYAEKDERIKVICQENQGLSEARNAGMANAHGEWMMFVDSDDWLEQDCCERIMNGAEGNDLVFFSYIREFKNSSAQKYIFDEQERVFSKETMDWLYERLIAPKGEELRDPSKLDSLSTAWGKCYRSDVIKEHGLTYVSTKEIGTEDLLFNVEYFKYARQARYVATPLYHYRKATLSTLSSLHKEGLEEKWQNMFERVKDIVTPLNRDELLTALERRKALCLFGLGLNIVFSGKGWRQEYRMLNDIVCSDWYTRAIAELDTSPMPLHWKYFYHSARHQHTWTVLLMLQMINVIINR